jgi:hypothetical protein
MDGGKEQGKEVRTSSDGWQVKLGELPYFYSTPWALHKVAQIEETQAFVHDRNRILNRYPSVQVYKTLKVVIL